MIDLAKWVVGTLYAAIVVFIVGLIVARDVVSAPLTGDLLLANPGLIVAFSGLGIMLACAVVMILMTLYSVVFDG